MYVCVYAYTHLLLYAIRIPITDVVMYFFISYLWNGKQRIRNSCSESVIFLFHNMKKQQTLHAVTQYHMCAYIHTHTYIHTYVCIIPCICMVLAWWAQPSHATQIAHSKSSSLRSTLCVPYTYGDRGTQHGMLCFVCLYILSFFSSPLCCATVHATHSAYPCIRGILRV